MVAWLQAFKKVHKQSYFTLQWYTHLDIVTQGATIRLSLDIKVITAGKAL